MTTTKYPRPSKVRNSRFLYYLKNGFRLAIPKSIYRNKLQSVLDTFKTRPDRDYIADRVNYYNKMTPNTDIGKNPKKLSDHKLRGSRSMYFFDSFEYTRWFDDKLLWNAVFGDVTFIPEVPAIVKSRPIKGDNRNSVVLNLVKVRHFNFLQDPIPYRQKKDNVVFRGDVYNKISRIGFLEKWFGSEICDAGETPSRKIQNPDWIKPFMPIADQLQSKFILALEGNDVATNLKWVMSSNSVAVMPEPTYETWYMEGRLIPDYHYICIAPDFSDFEDKIKWYNERPEKVEEIINNAHQYIAQFGDKKREDLISLLVLEKYFKMTGQI